MMHWRSPCTHWPRLDGEMLKRLSEAVTNGPAGLSQLDRWKDYVGLDEEGGKKADEVSGDEVFAMVKRMKGWAL